ncbi:MAG TPA: Ig-like domain-containing protein [Gemmatimonadaceae bacterium]
MRRSTVLVVLSGLALSTIACSEASGPDRSGIQVASDSVSVWIGESAKISATVTNADGDVLTEPVQFQSLTPTVSVDQSGTVTGLKRGQGEIRLTAGSYTKTISVKSFPIVKGKLYSPIATDFSKFTPTWKSTSKSDAGSAQANGEFVVRVSTLDEKGELLIDSPSPRGFHPFLYQLDADSAANLSVVLVPTSWTIERGIYKGQTVSTSLDLVMDEPSLNPYYWGSTDGNELFIEPQAIRIESFPLKVAIDHRFSAPDLTPADSAEIWFVLNRLEEIFGIDMFQPALADPSWWPDAEPHAIPGVMRVTKDGVTGSAGASYPLSSNQPAVWQQNLGSWATGRFSKFTVTRTILNSGWLVYGTEPFPTMGPRTVQMHETLHILGVGHTSRIPSTQGPAMRTAEPSKYDVAYIELLRAITVLEQTHDTFLGLVPATIGERRIMLNKSTLPALQP